MYLDQRDKETLRHALTTDGDREPVAWLRRWTAARYGTQLGDEIAELVLTCYCIGLDQWGAALARTGSTK